MTRAFDCSGAELHLGSPGTPPANAAWRWRGHLAEPPLWWLVWDENHRPPPTPRQRSFARALCSSSISDVRRFEFATSVTTKDRVVVVGPRGFVVTANRAAGRWFGWPAHQSELPMPSSPSRVWPAHLIRQAIDADHLRLDAVPMVTHDDAVALASVEAVSLRNPTTGEVFVVLGIDQPRSRYRSAAERT